MLMTLPSTTHDGMPSTSMTYGMRSSMPGGADRVQRSWRSYMWESASITLTGRSVSSCVMGRPPVGSDAVGLPRVSPLGTHTTNS